MGTVQFDGIKAEGLRIRRRLGEGGDGVGNGGIAHGFAKLLARC